MADRDGLRAGDADRQQVADQLRVALDEGRLSLAEYDERLSRAYQAKTYGELDALLHDLPAVRPASASQVQPAGSAGSVMPIGRGHIRQWLAGMWGSWLSVSLICVVIWAATSLGGGRSHYFWPIWVIGPWGAVLLASTIGGLISGAPTQHWHRATARAAERDRRRAARWGQDPEDR